MHAMTGLSVKIETEVCSIHRFNTLADSEMCFILKVYILHRYFKNKVSKDIINNIKVTVKRRVHITVLQDDEKYCHK